MRDKGKIDRNVLWVRVKLGAWDKKKLSTLLSIGYSIGHLKVGQN